MSKFDPPITEKLKDLNSYQLPQCHTHGPGLRFHSYCQQCGELLEHQNQPYIPSPINSQKNLPTEINSPLSLELDAKIFTTVIPNRDAIPNFSSFEHNGIIWVGYGAKQYALLDLLDDNDIVKQVRKFTDKKIDEKPIRAFANGNWLIAWSNRRIIVEDLLAIINGNKYQVPFAFEYEVEREDTEICPKPIAAPITIEIPDSGEMLNGLELTWLELESRNKHAIKRVIIGHEVATNQKSEIIGELKLNLGEMKGWPYLIHDHETPEEMILVTGNNEQAFHYFFLDDQKHNRHHKINAFNANNDMKKLRWALRPYDEERGSIIIENFENNKTASIMLTYTDENNETSTFMAKFDLKSKKLLETERTQFEEGKKCVGTVLIPSQTSQNKKYHIAKDNANLYLSSSINTSKIEANLALNNNMFIKTSKDGFMIFSENSSETTKNIIKTHYILDSKGSLAREGYITDEISNCNNTSDWNSLTKSITVTQKSTVITLKAYPFKNLPKQ